MVQIFFGAYVDLRIEFVYHSLWIHGIIHVVFISPNARNYPQ
jgi:hypothetical protein